MKIFIQKLLVFLLIPCPIFLCIFIPSFYVAYNSGELLTVDEIATVQQRDDILVGTAIQNIDSQFKFITTKKLKPNILALGTSRVMQFRREYFTDDILFYNAGGAVASLPQYIDFIAQMETYPELILVGLDQYYFNENWAKKNSSNITYQDNYNFMRIIINTFKMLLKRKISINQTYQYITNIGLTAKIYGDGFSKDGSYFSNFSNRILNNPDSDYSKSPLDRFIDTTERIDAGNRRFEYGSEIYEKSIEQMSKLLKECSKHDIEVIAFIPPFAPYINTILKESSNYAYMEKIYPTLLPVFNNYGYELYDFTESSDFSDDTMYFDGFHGNEETYHHILYLLKDKNSSLAKYIK
jgi:hypothetical protein